MSVWGRSHGLDLPELVLPGGPRSRMTVRAEPVPFATEFSVLEAMTARGFLTYNDDQGEYRLLALQGERCDGLPVVLIQFEAPARDQLGAVSKDVRERRDAHQFLTEGIGLATSSFTLRAGSDPPDLVVGIGGKEVSLELAQLHLPGPAGTSRESTASLGAAFVKVVDELVRRSSVLKSKLRLLRGHRVLVSFGQRTGNSMPPKLSDESRIDEMIEFLETVVPKAFLRQVGADPAPDIRESIQYNASQTVGASLSRIQAPLQPSPLWRTLGFEMALSHNREITQADVVSELRRIINQHDRYPSDLLVITTGSPTAQGWRFFSDCCCSALIDKMADPLSGYVPQNIKRIAIHDMMRRKNENSVRWLYGGPDFWG